MHNLLTQDTSYNALHVFQHSCDQTNVEIKWKSYIVRSMHQLPLVIKAIVFTLSLPFKNAFRHGESFVANDNCPVFPHAVLHGHFCLWSYAQADSDAAEDLLQGELESLWFFYRNPQLCRTRADQRQRLVNLQSVPIGECCWLTSCKGSQTETQIAVHIAEDLLDLRIKSNCSNKILILLP